MAMAQPVFVLGEEEQCALEDIARFVHVDAVAQPFRDKLLLLLAKAATSAMNEDDACHCCDNIDCSIGHNRRLAIQFIGLSDLKDGGEL